MDTKCLHSYCNNIILIIAISSRVAWLVWIVTCALSTCDLRMCSVARVICVIERVTCAWFAWLAYATTMRSRVVCAWCSTTLKHILVTRKSHWRSALVHVWRAYCVVLACWLCCVGAVSCALRVGCGVLVAVCWLRCVGCVACALRVRCVTYHKRKNENFNASWDTLGQGSRSPTRYLSSYLSLSC